MNTKEYLKLIGAAIAIVVSINFIACNIDPYIKKHTDVTLNKHINTVKDSISKEITILQIRDSLRYSFVIDSLKLENNNLKTVIREAANETDSLNEELIVANYKLERIKYYNDIAKNGNNLKYLRGWINRVLQ